MIGLIGEFWPLAIYGGVVGLGIGAIWSWGFRRRLRALEKANTLAQPAREE